MKKKKLKKRRKKKVNIDKILANAILASEKRIESAGTIFASLEEIEAYPTPSDTVMPRIQVADVHLREKIQKIHKNGTPCFLTLSGNVITQEEADKVTNEIVSKSLDMKTPCDHFRHNNCGERMRSRVHWMEHSNHQIKGVCGACFLPFDTHNPADLARYQQDLEANGFNVKFMGRAVQENIKYVYVPRPHFVLTPTLKQRIVFHWNRAKKFLVDLWNSEV